MRDSTFAFLTVAVLAGVFGCGLGAGYSGYKSKFQREAVELGYADWVVDIDGNVTWKWKAGIARPPLPTIRP